MFKDECIYLRYALHLLLNFLTFGNFKHPKNQYTSFSLNHTQSIHFIFFAFSSQIYRSSQRWKLRARSGFLQLFNRHFGQSCRNTVSLGLGSFQLGVSSEQVYSERSVPRLTDPIDYQNVRHRDEIKRNGKLLRQVSRCWCRRDEPRQSFRNSIE